MSNRATRKTEGPHTCTRCGENIPLLAVQDYQYGLAWHDQCWHEDQLDWEWLRESNAIEGVFDEESFKQALIAWHYLRLQPKLGPGVILKTHKILMLKQPLMPNEKGYWRREQVWVGGREGAPWRSVPDLVAQWCDRVVSCIGFSKAKQIGEVESRKQAVLEQRIKADHVEYERIHPFIDGNGRTGRMFMNWQRLQCGLPVIVIKDAEKRAYYQWFSE